MTLNLFSMYDLSKLIILNPWLLDYSSYCIYSQTGCQPWLCDILQGIHLFESPKVLTDILWGLGLFYLLPFHFVNIIRSDI